MSTAPAHLQDAKALLSNDGFATGKVWYHGTSSGLQASILEHGLKRSGDKAMNQAAKKTMATIGNAFVESLEPVFLTQCREIAHYWAEQTVRDRSVRIAGQEQPVVIAITLPSEDIGKVKPDVGAASLLMIKEGEAYLAFIAKLYESAGLPALSIDLMNAERFEYLNKLGMAYYNYDITSQYLDVVVD